VRDSRGVFHLFFGERQSVVECNEMKDGSDSEPSNEPDHDQVAKLDRQTRAIAKYVSLVWQLDHGHTQITFISYHRNNNHNCQYAVFYYGY